MTSLECRDRPVETAAICINSQALTGLWRFLQGDNQIPPLLP